MCFALIAPLDVLGEGGEGEEELSSVDHGRRTDEGRDKKDTLLYTAEPSVRYIMLSLLTTTSQLKCDICRSFPAVFAENGCS